LLAVAAEDLFVEVDLVDDLLFAIFCIDSLYYMQQLIGYRWMTIIGLEELIM
jgi:hypothetical protein